MVTIENPESGKPSQISERSARRLIELGAAVPTSRCNGQLLLIRMTGTTDKLTRLATVRGYDSVDRMMDQELPSVPVVQHQKMIRQERSSRNFSYSSAVKRSMSVAAINAGGRGV